MGFCQSCPSPTHDAVTARPRRDPATPSQKAAAEDAAARVLLDRLAEGQTPAFWELWAIYRPHLYHICLSHMGGVREDAEDALSRAMLRALDTLGVLNTTRRSLAGGPVDGSGSTHHFGFWRGP